MEQLKEFPRKIKSISMAGQGEPLANPRFPEILGKNGLEQKGFSYKHIDWNIFFESCGAIERIS